MLLMFLTLVASLQQLKQLVTAVKVYKVVMVMTEPLAKPSMAPEKCCPCQKPQGGAGNKKAEQVND